MADPARPADSLLPGWAERLQPLRWTRSSYLLLSLFFAVIILIVIVWWPLVTDYFDQVDPRRPLWTQVDWLLLGLFAFMSLVIMAGADLRADARILAVGLAGGLVIESWGTQTSLWTYYTLERPPLWIIPAWPIASLTIDRLYRLLDHCIPASLAGHDLETMFRWASWTIFPAFLAVMIEFVWPTRGQSLTVLAFLLCLLIVLASPDKRAMVLTFAVGSALGYFLEVWGTTRLCWTYYTLEQPPFFAVLAHGMAAVAFWRVALLSGQLPARIRAFQPRRSAQE